MSTPSSSEWCCSTVINFVIYVAYHCKTKLSILMPGLANINIDSQSMEQTFRWLQSGPGAWNMPWIINIYRLLGQVLKKKKWGLRFEGGGERQIPIVLNDADTWQHLQFLYPSNLGRDDLKKIFFMRSNLFTSYWELRLCLYEKPWGGSLYLPRVLPMWQNFCLQGKYLSFL